MKIDPYKIFEQMLDQHIKGIQDWIAFTKMDRDFSDYQTSLKRVEFQSIASIFSTVNDPYAFLERRITDMLEDYDKREKRLGEDFAKVKDWLRENQIADASIKQAWETVVDEKKEQIRRMVTDTKNIATLLLDDCHKMGYVGDNLAYLKAIIDQTPEEIITLYISFY